MQSQSAADLPDLDAGQLSAAYAAGELSPVEVVTACLRRMDEREPALRAMYDRYDDDALAAAEASRRRWEQGAQRGPGRRAHHPEGEPGGGRPAHHSGLSLHSAHTGAAELPGRRHCPGRWRVHSGAHHHV